MRNFKKTKVRNDAEEAAYISYTHKFVTDPQNHLLSELKPKLEKQVEMSKGLLKGFHLFDDHGHQEKFGNGKYPKRNKKMKFSPQVEDKAILCAGIHVGYMLSAIPWLHPSSWKGLGIALDNIPDQAEIIERRAYEKEQYQQIEARRKE